MVFENEVQYDKTTAQTLVEVGSRVLWRKSFLIRRSILLVVGPFALVCGCISMPFFGEMSTSVRVFGVFDLLMGILLLWRGVFYRRVMVRRILRTMTGGERRAVFTEEEIQVEQPGVQKVAFYYSTVKAFYETEAHFILPLSTKANIVLDKAGFVQGTVAEFRTFLQERTGLTAQFVNWK